MDGAYLDEVKFGKCIDLCLFRFFNFQLKVVYISPNAVYCSYQGFKCPTLFFRSDDSLVQHQY